MTYTVELSGTMVNHRVDQENWLWVKNVVSSGVKDDGPIKNIKTSHHPIKRLTCLHRTRPRANFSVFYRRIDGTHIKVIGYGKHSGTTDKKYKVDWADGSTSTIDLDKKAAKTNPQFTPGD